MRHPSRNLLKNEPSKLWIEEVCQNIWSKLSLLCEGNNLKFIDLLSKTLIKSVYSVV